MHVGSDGDHSLAGEVYGESEPSQGNGASSDGGYETDDAACDVPTEGRVLQREPTA